MKIKYILMILLVSFLLSACQSQDQFPVAEEKTPYNNDLIEWLPQNGDSFIYKGDYDYLHSELVTSVEDDIYVRRYRVEGEVSSNTTTPASFSYEYTIEKESVVRLLDGFGAIDDKFAEMTLLKLPIEKGHSWSESVTDAYGNSYDLVSTIESVDTYDGKTYVEVIYEDSLSDYYEIRRFESGTGIVFCAVQYTYGDNVTELSYDLSGTYVVQEEITVDKDVDEVSEPVKDPVLEDNATKEEREAISGLIQDFNDAWILYINENDLRVFEYLVPGEPAYVSVNTFNKEGLKERFVLLDIGLIKVNGDRAQVNVYEEIEHIREDEIKLVTYNWVYEVRQFNGIWLIENYFSTR